jgi:4'-phosphopantetheinyl transferase
MDRLFRFRRYAPSITMPISSSIVSIWHAANSSGDPGDIESQCESWLDEPDRERADLFRRATTRNQHVIGRGMSRRLLSGPTMDPRSIRFGVEPHGKPMVSGPPAAKRPFNVTHTDGLVMCCVGDSNHQAVGIDVERLSRRTDTAIADRYFSKPEIDFLHRCRSEDSRRRTFLRIWTLKESFIKAIGTGLTMPLADFAFDQIDSDCPTIRMLNPDLESDSHWRFYSIQPRPGFIAALAVETESIDTEIDYELIDFEDVIRH